MLEVSVELKNLEGLEWSGSLSQSFALEKPNIELLCFGGGLTMVDGYVDVGRDDTMLIVLAVFFFMVPPSWGDLCELLLLDEIVVLVCIPMACINDEAGLSDCTLLFGGLRPLPRPFLFEFLPICVMCLVSWLLLLVLFDCWWCSWS